MSDWTEDMLHENGCYENTCTVCEARFIGHKRRRVCKSCSLLREMTLEEWCGKLPEFHRANRELAELKAENTALREKAQEVVDSTIALRKCYGSVISFEEVVAIDALASVLGDRGSE